MKRNKRHLLKTIFNAFTAMTCLAGAFMVLASLQKATHASASTSGGEASLSGYASDESRDVILSQAERENATSLSSTDDSKQNILLNDPTVQMRWGQVKTDTSHAWEINRGCKEAIPAIVDTGVDVNHPDLKDSLWVNTGESGLDAKGRDKASNQIDDDKNGYIDDVHGWNFVANNNDLTDNHGHGTHIAGIIAANGAKHGGVNGVAPSTKLMILKYYDPKAPGTNNLRNTIQAFLYAVKMGATIINYSGGGVEYSQEEHDAVKAALDKGILFVAAAGNERSNSDEKDRHYYPADYGLANIISVTAVNPSVSVLASSNYGVRTVDIAAPGENIFSTLPGGGHGTMTGTSQATAFVTAVADLVKCNNQDFTYADIKKTILHTGDEYATLLSKTGTARLLNSYKALSISDKGTGATGVVATNTQGMNTHAFDSDQDLKNPKLNTSAMSNSAQNEGDPAESIASFGREFMHKLGGVAQAIQPVAESKVKTN